MVKYYILLKFEIYGFIIYFMNNLKYCVIKYFLKKLKKKSSY